MHTIRISIRLVKRKIWAEKHPLSPPCLNGRKSIDFSPKERYDIMD